MRLKGRSARIFTLLVFPVAFGRRAFKLKMKHLITLLILTSTLNAQTVTHHVDGQGRKVQIHTFHKPERDSVICYVYGRPGRWDRPIISLTRRGEAYDHLFFVLRRKNKKTKFWSFLRPV